MVQSDTALLYRVLEGLGEIKGTLGAYGERLEDVEARTGEHSGQLAELLLAAEVVTAISKRKREHRARFYAWCGAGAGLMAMLSAAAGFATRHTIG